MFNFFFKPPKQKTAQKNILEETIQGVALKFKKHHASKCIRISIKDTGPVLVTLPKRMSFSHARAFALLHLDWLKSNALPLRIVENPQVVKDLRTLAKKELPKRLQELAGLHGFNYARVSIKNMKTRWGSCSFLNNINLNLNLMRLEDDLIDYVLLHELAHTVEKNHGPRFWALLESCMPNAREVRKKLRTQKTS
jgi:predicted metal-dependent hydrolase